MLSLFSASAAFNIPLVPAVPVQMVKASVPAPVPLESAHPGIFPTSELLASLATPVNNGDVYRSGTSDLDLSKMLDEIPISDLDPKGAKGIEQDEKGVDRLQERVEAKEKADAIKFQRDLANGSLD